MNGISEESKLRIKQTIEKNRVGLLENIEKAGLIWVHRHRLFGVVMQEAKVIDVSYGLGFQIVETPSGRLVASVELDSRSGIWLIGPVTEEEKRKSVENMKDRLPRGYFHPCAATEAVYAWAMKFEQERDEDLRCFKSGEARGDMPLKDAIPDR